jgi:curli biogenesis system outer membrane secretion channel CsgG
MGKRFLFVACGIVLVSLVGCATLQQMTQPTAQVDNYANATPLPPYSGPKVRVAIADFDVKAAKATGEIGSGLREMLITALLNSNRFSIVERQSLGAVMQEQELAATQQGPGPERGKIKTADLIISAAVTEFEPQSSGGVGGIGGGGSIGSGVLGGLLGVSYNKAHMALDIRIIDASTSEIIASQRVQGQASDIGGAIMGGFFGNWALGAGLSAYAKTPMEKAIRICIIEGVRYISQVIPANYYKY